MKVKSSAASHQANTISTLSERLNTVGRRWINSEPGAGDRTVIPCRVVVVVGGGHYSNGNQITIPRDRWEWTDYEQPRG